MKFNKRRDLTFVFECRNGNPNGDPDADNMPRMDPVTGIGFTTDVWLKRIIRDLMLAAPPTPKEGYDIFVRSGLVINHLLEEATLQTAPGVKDVEEAKRAKAHARATFEWLVWKYFDLRAFGGVMTTGETEKAAAGEDPEAEGDAPEKGRKGKKAKSTNALKGSVYGQIRGPVAVTFARSICPIHPSRVTMTRCMVTSEKDIDKERTMGGKWVVPYGVYVGTISVSVVEAEKTGFSQEDYDHLLFYISHLFDNNKSASRSDLRLRSLVEFTHEGSGGDPREQVLGCQPDWKLHETVKVRLKDGVTEPTSWEDIDFQTTFTPEAFPGVSMRVVV